MFYKVVCNNMVIDLLDEVCYVRYLTGQKRSVITDRGSANGILSSDHNTIYHLAGRPYLFEDDVKTVYLEQIDEAQFKVLKSQLMYQQGQQADLQNRVSALEELVGEQNELLKQLLEKLG